VAFAEPGTLAQHALLADVLDAVEAASGATIRLRVAADGLTGGGVTYDHLAGVRVGAHPVGGPADLPRALEALA
jgi:hypothetical protein